MPSSSMVIVVNPGRCEPQICSSVHLSGAYGTLRAADLLIHGFISYSWDLASRESPQPCTSHLLMGRCEPQISSSVHLSVTIGTLRATDLFIRAPLSCPWDVVSRRSPHPSIYLLLMGPCEPQNEKGLNDPFAGCAPIL